MAAFVVSFLLLLAMAAHSDASYCVCNSGLSDSVLQKNIDYACGNGADCSSILQNGPCYNPNTMRDHCNYAVNSYYQRKGQIPGSCDFLGTATVSPTAPSAGSGCVYQSSPSGGSTTPTTPTTGTPPNAGGTGTPPNAGGTGGVPNAGGTGTPPNAGGTGTPPNAGGTGTPPNAGGTTVGGAPNTGGTTIGGTPNTGSTTPGTLPGSVSPTIGLGPSGSGFGNTDGSGSVKLSSQSSTIFMLVSFSLSVLVYGLVL